MIKFIKVVAIAGAGFVAAGAIGVDQFYSEEMTTTIRMAGAGALAVMLCLLMTFPGFRAMFSSTKWKAMIFAPTILGFFSHWITKFLTNSARAAHCVSGLMTQSVGISQGINITSRFWKFLQFALCANSIYNTVKETVKWEEFQEAQAEAKAKRDEFFKEMFA